MTRKLRFTLLPALVGLLAACSDDGGATNSSEMIASFDSEAPVRVPGGGGGYVWSYSSGEETGTTVEPVSSETVAFALDGKGKVKKAATITYSIAPEPDFNSLGITWSFRDTSGGWAYPTGGLGFSFKDKSAPFSIPKSKLGIKFWAKGTGSTNTKGITIEFPTADTDVASSADAFETSCTCSAVEGACDPDQARGLDGKPTNNGTTRTKAAIPENHTCFANFAYRIKPTTEWKLYAVLFKDLRWADQDPETGEDKEYLWVDRPALEGKELEGTDDPKGWDRRKALKVQFAPFRPATGEEPAVGELSVDEVQWVVASDKISESGEVTNAASSNE